MADKPLNDNPERGWGQLLPLFFRRDIQIINYARNGRSTKSFINEGLWARVINNLKPGDYVFIQFGHNDAKSSDTTRYAEAHTTYRANLIKFITESRQHGAYPILITPVNRRKFSEEGKFIDQHGAYPEVVREIAATYAVPLIDLHRRSQELLEQLGPEQSEALFLRANPGVYKAFPAGKSDNTHFMRTGAIMVAQLVIAELQRIQSPLVQFLTRPPEFSVEGQGKVVGLDYYFYQHRQHELPDGRKLPVGYTWEDRSDSGFYELGNLFENQGAFIAAVTEPPTLEALQKLSLYILVINTNNTNTNAKTPIPSGVVTTLINWVQAGGVLVLLPTDAYVSSPFDTLLAECGMHLKPLQPVPTKPLVIKQFPPHPIFAGITQLCCDNSFIIECQNPANPLLQTKYGAVMATAEIGQGLVFVSAAPMLNNAHFYQSNLPVEFESWIGGQNCCRWLLSQARTVRKV
jgi:lysophospholipase L1-like esterase